MSVMRLSLIHGALSFQPWHTQPLFPHPVPPPGLRHATLPTPFLSSTTPSPTHPSRPPPTFHASAAHLHPCGLYGTAGAQTGVLNALQAVRPDSEAVSKIVNNTLVQQLVRPVLISG